MTPWAIVWIAGCVGLLARGIEVDARDQMGCFFLLAVVLSGFVLAVHSFG